VIVIHPCSESALRPHREFPGRPENMKGCQIFLAATYQNEENYTD
jgi:hypothetical protein